MKFLQLNIWEGGRNWDEMVSFIRDEQPDILCLQEVFDGTDPSWEKRYRTLHALSEELDYPFESFGPMMLETEHADDFGTYHDGNAVLSRFPIVHEKTHFFDKPLTARDAREMRAIGDFSETSYGFQEVTLDVDGTDLSVFSVHGIWGKDGEDNDRRLTMGRQLKDCMNGKKYAIMSGDFNAKDYTKSMQQVEEVATHVFKGQLEGTFNMRHKSGQNFAEAVIDMIYVSKGIKVDRAYTSERDVSDHLPLVMEFSFN